jgi:hypothetical protein
MPISLNGDGIISGVTTFTTSVTGVTTFTTVNATQSNATNLSVSGIATVAAGSTSAPSITTSGDNNTGLFFPSADTISFATGGTERGRWISGGGLTFNGDTAAANALDDYEEGTWTPTLNSTSGETYSSRAGTYTKIGNIVHVVGQIVLSNKGSSTGNLTFGTLPFAKRSLDSSRTPFVIYYENLTTSVNNLWGYQDETTRFLIYKVTGTGTNPTLFAHADLANNTVLNFSFVYPTT